MKKTFTVLLALAISLPGWAKGSHQSHQSTSITHSKSAAAPKTPRSNSSSHYTNVDGKKVHRPVHTRTAPAGATAQCGDGSYSFSQHHQGTCSHHGGVSGWITH